MRHNPGSVKPWSAASRYAMWHRASKTKPAVFCVIPVLNASSRTSMFFV